MKDTLYQRRREKYRGASQQFRGTQRRTPDEERAPEWYRFVLCHPAVTVGLMAPAGRKELEEDLLLLDNARGFTDAQYAALRAHGDRVHRHAGRFP
jgi:hypothetical protein